MKLDEWLGQLDEELDQWPSLLLLKAKILTNDLARYQEALAVSKQAESIFLSKEWLVEAIEAQIWQAESLRMMGEGQKSLRAAKKAYSQLKELVVPKDFLAWATRYLGLAHGAAG